MSQAIAEGWNFTTAHTSPTALRVEVTNLDEGTRTLVLEGATVRGTTFQGVIEPQELVLGGLETAKFTITLPEPFTSFEADATLRLYFATVEL